MTRSSYWLTRFVILRLLGLVYLAAFVSAATQIVALVGEHGLLPVGDFLRRVEELTGSRLGGFERHPSLFWLGASDSALRAAAWVGVALSIPVLLGFANAILLAILW